MMRCRSTLMLSFSLNPLDAVLHIKNIAEKENINCGEDVVYLKTETKPFTQNAYLLHYLSSLHSRLTQEPKDMDN